MNFGHIIPKRERLPFKKGTKRPDKSNAIDLYVEGTPLDGEERAQWESLFETLPAPLTPEERASHAAALKEVVVASDAFFPFRDGIDAAAAVGITCVIQPGGSIRDDEVIAAADEHGIAMIFTDMRHFRH